MNLNFLSGVTDLWSGMTLATLAFLPNLLGGIFVFAVGLILGNLARTLVIKTLATLNFEKAIKDTKFREFLTKAEITEKFEELLGSFIKWLIVLTFFMAATNLWGLTTVSSLLLSILGYLPSVVAAIIILTIGTLLAGLVESVTKASISGFDVRTARLMGKIASYLVMILSILAALSELRIAKDFINILFIGFVATLSLGFGLALGLGAKDTVSELISTWYRTHVKTKN